MEAGVIFVLAIGLALGIRLLAGSMDGDRVDKYVRERGGRLLEKRWAPLGKGWLGEKDSRIYEITYVDREGNTHRATCKTSAFSGVYFTEDTIVKSTSRAPSGTAAELRGARSDGSDLVEENRRLRAELERLRRREG